MTEFKLKRGCVDLTIGIDPTPEGVATLEFYEPTDYTSTMPLTTQDLRDLRDWLNTQLEWL